MNPPYLVLRSFKSKKETTGMILAKISQNIKRNLTVLLYEGYYSIENGKKLLFVLGRQTHFNDNIV